MADVQQQLGALLGREVKQLRTTNEDPPRINVIDVVKAITGQANNNAGKILDRIKASYPDFL